MIDNILYEDIGGLILDIDVSNTGVASNILYNEIKGTIQNISLSNNGSLNNILFDQNLLETLPPSPAELGFGYFS